MSKFGNRESQYYSSSLSYIPQFSYLESSHRDSLLKSSWKECSADVAVEPKLDIIKSSYERTEINDMSEARNGYQTIVKILAVQGHAITAYS